MKAISKTLPRPSIMNIESTLSRAAAQRIERVVGGARRCEFAGKLRSPNVKTMRQIDAIGGPAQGA
jgi:hypothetical protein